MNLRAQSQGLARRLLLLTAALALVYPALAGPCCCSGEAPQAAATTTVASDHSCCAQSAEAPTQRMLPAPCDCDPTIVDTPATIAVIDGGLAGRGDMRPDLDDDTARCTNLSSTVYNAPDQSLLLAPPDSPSPGETVGPCPARAPPVV